jgi:HK97 family phage major capsid protein
MHWRKKRKDDEKKALLTEAQLTLDKATRDGRDLTAQEQTTIDDMHRQVEAINVWMKDDAETERQFRNAEPVAIDGPGDTQGPVGRRQSAGGGMVFQNQVTGGFVRALRHDEPFCTEPVGDGEPHFVGRAIQSWLTGRTDSPAFKASVQQGNVDIGGGFLFEPKMGSMFVDLARAASVCLRAGAQTLPMDAGEIHIARATTDPTSYWRGEGIKVPASVRAFDQVILKARTLAAVVPITIELMEDAVNAPTIIEQALSASMALKLDQAALSGTGAESEPLGIRNHPTVQTVTSVGTPTDYTEVSTAVKKILAANYNGDVAKLAWIQNPRDGGTYDNLQDTLHQPLRMTPWVEKLQQFFTTSVNTVEGSGADSFAVVGDFGQMLIGMRTSGIVLRRINGGAAADILGTTLTAPDMFLEFICCYLRADIVLLRPTWFTVLSGITSA